MKFPSYSISLHISHNDHKSSYESVEDWIEFLNVEEDEFVSEGDMEKAINEDSLWEVHWYPDTPIGFYRAFGATLETALEKANQIETEIKKGYN